MRWRSAHPGVVVLGLLALVATGPLLAHPATTTTQGGRGDDTLFLWWLGYVPHALVHGGGLAFTEALNAPQGVNVWWQTSMVGPALILAPLTVTAGAAASLVVLNFCAFFLTAASTYALAFRLTRHRAGAFVAGLLTGFGPYVAHHAGGHPNLAVWAIPPLLGLVLHEGLVAQRARDRVLGLLLAFLVVLQFLASTEVLATAAIAAAVVVVASCWVGRDQLRARARYAVRALGVAAVTSGVLLALPLDALVRGRQGLQGPAQPGIPRVRADLLSAVVPGPVEPGHGWGLSRFATPPEGVAEATAYLGIPLLLVAVLVVLRQRRDPVVRVIAVTGLVTWLLSLGSPLTVDGHATGVPLPEALLPHLPLLRSAVPERFSAFTLLAAALLVATGVARGFLPLPAGGRLRIVEALAVPALLVATLLPLALPLHGRRLEVPRWFHDTAALRRLPPGAVLTVPMASSVDPWPMTWAAAAGYRFDLVGGYVITPDRTGAGTFRIRRPWPQITTRLLGGSPPPDPTGPAGLSVRSALRRDGVGTIVVPLLVPGAPAVASWFAQATGTPVRPVDDVLLVEPWSGVRPRLSATTATGGAAGP